MSIQKSPTASCADQEVAALIETLHETGLRLEVLTGGEVDAVIGPDGVAFLLQRAQEELRLNEASRQAAILNALPAHIALVDSQGAIVSFNRAWQEFAEINGLPTPGYGIGINYLDTCDKARGGAESAEGIRAVLAGESSSFSIEYPCHSPTQQRWFLMTVTPSSDAAKNGAVIMHLDISDRMLAEIGMKRLNRVYAVLSEINALVVHVRDRDELFREACRIAVETGGLRMAMVAMVDKVTGKLVPSVTAGTNEELLQVIRNAFASDEGGQTTLLERALLDKTAMVSNDTDIDPRIMLGAAYAKAGFRALAALPLMVAEEAVGILALYVGEKDFFHEEEMKLLSGLTDDIALAIEHIERQERLDYAASFDRLTGLANHGLFLDRLAQCMRSAADSGHRLGLFLIDLERFKNINDSLGQPAGDALLQQVAMWLTQYVDDVNRVGRIGADHFAVVVPEVGYAGDLTQQLDMMIETFLHHPFRLNNNIYRVAARVGVAIFPDDGAAADTLYKNAEAALKKAKAGGHRHLFYTQKMTESVAQRLSLETQLRQALDNQEFVLHYQPKVSLATGRVTSVEALIRWNDPRNDPRTGLVAPGLFIPILEETGLIYDVGMWALHQALKDYL
ncbi:MAG: diguanylate cyclase, partial [Pseudomonadota bacterium]|nr:diguanylate cyclase [Pseudomonadota bacterium]